MHISPGRDDWLAWNHLFITNIDLFLPILVPHLIDSIDMNYLCMWQSFFLNFVQFKTLKNTFWLCFWFWLFYFIWFLMIRQLIHRFTELHSKIKLWLITNDGSLKMTFLRLIYRIEKKSFSPLLDLIEMLWMIDYWCHWYCLFVWLSRLSLQWNPNLIPKQLLH